MDKRHRFKGKESKREEPKTPARAKSAQELAKRSARRRTFRQKNITCFHCRQWGHSANECPSGTDREVCYRCGSNEHAVSKCFKKHDPANPFPFAQCFVCKTQGHLAGQCPKNEMGIYPGGGSCRYCGSVRHLARDCRPAQVESGEVTVGIMDASQGGDFDEDVPIQEIVEETVKPLQKIVKF